MKILHTSDLHIGKVLNEYSLLDEQKVFLEQIIAQAQTCDAVIIAGDVYDKSLPSAQAVKTVDDFISRLSQLDKPVFIISGNHDSAERISYAASVLEKHNIYVTKQFDGKLQKVTIDSINFFMLPFIKPHNVRPFYPDVQIDCYETAVKTVIENSSIDSSQINVLIAHQFVAGAQQCDSEIQAVGGVESISASAFDMFDYVALGHIHSPQKMMRETVRYSGSPLKYSGSEANHKKSMVIADIKGKKDIDISFVPFKPKNDLRKITGKFDDIMAMPYSEDYVFITVTDEEPPYDATSILRQKFPNIMQYSVSNSKTTYTENITAVESIENKTPCQLFEEFFESRCNGATMSEKQKAVIEKIINERGAGNETN